jgi:hypothetical protein
MKPSLTILASGGFTGKFVFKMAVSALVSESLHCQSGTEWQSDCNSLLQRLQCCRVSVLALLAHSALSNGTGIFRYETLSGVWSLLLDLFHN